MARIYPEVEPQSNSEAERLVYRVLSKLPDTYLVLHSVDITLPGERESEVDFLVATPDWGFLILEVKGGGITFDPKQDSWTSVDRRGREHWIKDPFAQAKANAHTISRMLKNTPSTAKFRYTYGHGVVFPDVRGKTAFTPEQQKRLLDADDLRDVAKNLARLAREWGPGAWERDRTLGTKAVEALEARFARSIYVKPIFKLEGIAQGIIRLTNDQVKLLTTLRNHREALIAGCAGSGKTFLAMEKAMWCYKNGMKVLLVCFNRPLADWIDEQLLLRLQGETETRGNGKPLVTTFHGLSARCARELGQVMPDNMKPGDEAWAEYVISAAARYDEGQRFDAIIVDEGQDFRSEWLIALDDVRKRGGYWYIFYDDNQRIYRTSVEWPIRAVPHYLSKNVRFTRSIHERVVHLYDGEPPDPPDIDGDAPEFFLGEGITGDRRLLRRVLHSVIHEDGLDPSDVIVLTPVAQDRSQLKENLRVGSVQLTWMKELVGKGQSRVLVSTIHRFKGLERSAVILAELESMMEWSSADWVRQREMLLYIGMSRASARLIVLGGKREWFEPRRLSPRGKAVRRELTRAVPTYTKGDRSQANLGSVERNAIQLEPDKDMDASGVEEQIATVRVQGAGNELSDTSAAAVDTTASELTVVVLAVLLARSNVEIVNNEIIQSALKSRKAILLEEPVGVLLSDSTLPDGSVGHIERIKSLPFTPDAWVVRASIRPSSGGE